MLPLLLALAAGLALWWLLSVRSSGELRVPKGAFWAPRPYAWAGAVLGPVLTVLTLCACMLADNWAWLYPYRTTAWISWWAMKHESFALDLGPKRRLVSAHDPESLKHMLSTNFSNYIRPEINTDVLACLLGDGIFNSNGSNWRFQRDTAHPFFRAGHINEHMVEVFVHHTHVLCRQLQRHARSGEPVDMQNLLSRYTLDTFLEVAFGLRISCLEQDVPFNGCFNRIITELTVREENPLSFLLFWRNAQFERDLATLNEFVWGIIREHKAMTREELRQRRGLLSQFLLLDAQPQLTDQFLRDITVNFLLAGRDTTAQTLLWNLFFVSQSPTVEARLLQELEKLEIDNVPSSAEQLHRMKYHKQVLNETLRLLPPVPLEGRQALQDDVLPNGCFVPAGYIVAYVGPLYHRMKHLWGEDADYFNPDRWAGERKDAIKPYQFLAFHGGDQRCLGQVLAYQEMKVALAGMIRSFSFELAMPLSRVHVTRGLTVSAKNGVLFRVRHRKDVSVDSLLAKNAPLFDWTVRDRWYWKTK